MIELNVDSYTRSYRRLPKSHSGRRSAFTEIVSSNKNKIAQKIAGHKSAATTLIYTEPSEADLTTSLVNVVTRFKNH